VNKLTSGARRLLFSEEGVTSIEYALIAALIAVVCVVMVTGVGVSANALWTAVCQAVDAAIPGAGAC
jgi:pilus assembly protein Flp/PilA